MASRKMKLQKEIADRLLLMRVLLFGNASDMARSVKLTPQRWYNYETGRRALDADVATIIVEEHGVDFNWLFAGKTKPMAKKNVKVFISHAAHDALLAIKMRKTMRKRRSTIKAAKRAPRKEPDGEPQQRRPQR